MMPQQHTPCRPGMHARAWCGHVSNLPAYLLGPSCPAVVLAASACALHTCRRTHLVKSGSEVWLSIAAPPLTQNDGVSAAEGVKIVWRHFKIMLSVGHSCGETDKSRIGLV